eukprot:GHVR01130570.1.p1 GENE.GHVR01130570.1~~GHVR01130570.1.p1  ORF type:complete len:334 (+),score=68.49 GHVR01130570.1:843-1844(+)
MAVNSFFHTSNVAAIATEQSLYSNLIKEAIQIYGHDVYYLDRTLVAEDTILGEDSLSKFTQQHPIEMYIEDSEGGFAGEKEIMSQFGLENLSEVTFVVNKIRFQELDRQMQIETETDTTGGSILLEEATIDQSDDSTTLSTASGDSNFYIIQDTSATDADRPNEGDVVYHPVLDKMFQVNFVDHDEPFYQLDNNPVYKLRCRLYDYSSEIIDTGIADIDAIEDELSVDRLLSQFTLEKTIVGESLTSDNNFYTVDNTDVTADSTTVSIDPPSFGESIMLENSSDSGDTNYLLQEDVKSMGDYSSDKTAQNELFSAQSATVLDFSESNPFGDPK